MSRKRPRDSTSGLGAAERDYPADDLLATPTQPRVPKRPRATASPGVVQQAVTIISSPVRWLTGALSPVIGAISTPFKWRQDRARTAEAGASPALRRAPVNQRRGSAASPVVVDASPPTLAGRTGDTSPDVVHLGTFVAGPGDSDNVPLSERRIRSLGSPAHTVGGRRPARRRSRSNIVHAFRKKRAASRYVALTQRALIEAQGQDLDKGLSAYAKHLAATAEGPTVSPRQRAPSSAPTNRPALAEQVANASVLLAAVGGHEPLDRRGPAQTADLGHSVPAKPATQPKKTRKQLPAPVVPKSLFLQAAMTTKTRPQVLAQAMDGPAALDLSKGPPPPPVPTRMGAAAPPPPPLTAEGGPTPLVTPNDPDAAIGVEGDDLGVAMPAPGTSASEPESPQGAGVLDSSDAEISSDGEVVLTISDSEEEPEASPAPEAGAVATGPEAGVGKDEAISRPKMTGSPAGPALADPGFLAHWMAEQKQERERLQGAVAEQEGVVSGIQELSILYAKGGFLSPLSLSLCVSVFRLPHAYALLSSRVTPPWTR